MKEISGYINSAGKTDGGVPYYDSPDHYILDGNKSYSMEEDFIVSPINKQKLPVVPYKDGFLIAGTTIDGKLTVCQYKRTKGKSKRKLDYTVSKSWSFDSIGAGRVSNMKRLQSGSILVAWYDEVRMTSKVFPRFSCFNGKKWTTLETYFDNLSMGAPWVSADFTQDIYGTIWYVGHGDSNKNFALIQLVERRNGEVEEVYLDPKFTYKGDEFQGWGEHPYIVCEPYQDGIILAYQGRETLVFSSSPHRRGCKIYVIKVNQDRSKEFIYRTEDYAERNTAFALVGTSIIYGPINPETLRYNEMYLLREDGTKTFLAEIKYPMLFRYTNDRYFCNSLEGNIIVVDLTK